MSGGLSPYCERWLVPDNKPMDEFVRGSCMHAVGVHVGMQTQPMDEFVRGSCMHAVGCACGYADPPMRCACDIRICVLEISKIKLKN